MQTKIDKLTKTFSFPGLCKTSLRGLAEKCNADVEIKGSGGAFELSGPPVDVQTLVTEAMHHCDFQNRPA